MINSINQVKFYNPRFRGAGVEISAPAKKGVNRMEELVIKMIEELKNKVIAKDVPPLGEFDVVWSEFENTDKAIDATHCLLKISSTGVKGSENMRYLEVAAIKRGTPYGAETVIGYGTIKDILNKLNERGLENIIKEKFIKLSKDLEDI